MHGLRWFYGRYYQHLKKNLGLSHISLKTRIALSLCFLSQAEGMVEETLGIAIGELEGTVVGADVVTAGAVIGVVVTGLALGHIIGRDEEASERNVERGKTVCELPLQAPKPHNYFF